MPGTIASVLTAGFYAGVNLSPVKASIRDLAEILSNQREALSRILLNTDSGAEFYENLDGFVRTDGPEEEVKAGLIKQNAAGFYGIPLAPDYPG
jgi:predicted metal-dependent TIM-barrel fold hydrolase